MTNVRFVKYGATLSKPTFIRRLAKWLKSTCIFIRDNCMYAFGLFRLLLPSALVVPSAREPGKVRAGA